MSHLIHYSVSLCTAFLMLHLIHYSVSLCTAFHATHHIIQVFGADATELENIESSTRGVVRLHGGDVMDVELRPAELACVQV